MSLQWRIQDFPYWRGWGVVVRVPTPQFREKTIVWKEFCQKLQENERNWTEGGGAGHVPSTRFDLPMPLMLLSCNLSWVYLNYICTSSQWLALWLTTCYYFSKLKSTTGFAVWAELQYYLIFCQGWKQNAVDGTPALSGRGGAHHMILYFFSKHYMKSNWRCPDKSATICGTVCPFFGNLDNPVRIAIDLRLKGPFTSS